ncbi:MAG: DUF3078 domain-containing protein [Sphingobacteriales bacterium]|nr:MAG: DUF3078 domain-containing protein [Sphingobacteriales bacterium]TAF82564.1 MAG: DUF3078 domain-containing protein [Sphingobacteriales bacterium]
MRKKLQHTVFIILAYILVFTITAKAQTEIPQIDTIKTQVSNPKKNPLASKNPINFIKKTTIKPQLLNIKINYWRTQSTISLNINQAAFSNNWSGGGVNSLALGGQFLYKAEYNKERVNYITQLDLIYGKLKNRNQLERKTNDRIFIDNKAALQISKNWYFFGSLSFESQFDIGYNFGKDATGNETRTSISNFMAPGYVTESVGFEYKPVTYFSLRLGTGTARQTFVLDTTLYKNNPKNFGVPIGKVFRNELAFQVVANFDKNIAPNLNLKSRYLMFAAYEKIRHIDQRLDVTLTAKVNKFINVMVNGVALYDDDFSNALQTSQALSIGMVYNLP